MCGSGTESMQQPYEPKQLWSIKIKIPRRSFIILSSFEAYKSEDDHAAKDASQHGSYKFVSTAIEVRGYSSESWTEEGKHY